MLPPFTVYRVLQGYRIQRALLVEPLWGGQRPQDDSVLHQIQAAWLMASDLFRAATWLFPPIRGRLCECSYHKNLGIWVLYEGPDFWKPPYGRKDLRIEIVQEGALLILGAFYAQKFDSYVNVASSETCSYELVARGPKRVCTLWSYFFLYATCRLVSRRKVSASPKRGVRSSPMFCPWLRPHFTAF